MTRFRGSSSHVKLETLTSGPGRLCKAMGITRAEHNGLDVTAADSCLQVLSNGFHPASIISTPRVGITKAMAMSRFVSSREDRNLGKVPSRATARRHL
jgi:DNA-3-methyladenine glycosylase